MGTLKKVRFRLAWQNYRVGDEITPPANLRDWLLASGYVEVVEDKPKELPAPEKPSRTSSHDSRAKSKGRQPVQATERGD